MKHAIQSVRGLPLTVYRQTDSVFGRRLETGQPVPAGSTGDCDADGRLAALNHCPSDGETAGVGADVGDCPSQ